MPAVMQLLKKEIARLARKEVKAELAPQMKTAKAARREIAELKKRVALLEQQIARSLPTTSDASPAPARVTPKSTNPREGAQISGKSVRGMRQKLRLTQSDFAKLVGVGHNTVYKWESKAGALTLRNKTREALLGLRGISPRQAKKKLASQNA